MSKRVICLWCGLCVLGAAGLAQGELVGHWKLDEGGGTKIADSSGKGNDGSVTAGNPTWIAGVQGSALLFHGLGVSGGGGDTITVPHSASLDIGGPISIALWIRPEADDPEGKATTTAPMAKAISTASPSWSFQVRYGWGGAPSPNMSFTFNTTPRAWAFVGRKLTRYEWCHIACAYDGTTLKCFLNATETGSTPMGAITKSPTPVLIGSDGWGCDWIGAIDDVRMYNNALKPEELKAVMSGPAKLAGTPSPADKAVDVPRDTSLTWKAGQFAVTHDVYVGKVFADVNTATTANKNLLVGQGQTDTSYRPAAGLDFGQTYYWRVDEVNKPADNVTFKGNVWSFTVEPYGYPVKPLKATASTAQAGMGPEKTIDGSGLTGDLHGVDGTTMWLAAGAAPNWIQYEFDKVYKFADLKVWNYNAIIETFMGFGAKQVKIETSVDGTTWTALANVPEFAKGTGLAGYGANTTVNFGGVEAKFVKLTVEKNWGGLAPQAGLSEVRFSVAPMQAFGPQPATAATGLGVEGVTLNWRPGREAASHKVFFGADQAAVSGGTAPVKTVTEHSFDPGTLNLGTTYYWKVDEVSAAAAYPGEVWSFTTEPYRLVDDFESYSDKAGNEIFSTWMDGFADNYKSSGSTVGLDTAKNGTFGETTIIHGGKQSMPLFYDNTKGPGFSETVLTLNPAQNWTLNGIKSLSLWFQGVAGNGGQLYVKINTTKVSYSGNDGDLARTAWLPWNIDLSKAGNVSKVTSLTIGIEGAGAKGTVYIDDIRLYPKAPEFITPVPPAATGLAASYPFDEGSGTVAKDSSGNGNNGTLEGNPTWADGQSGKALAFSNSRVTIRASNSLGAGMFKAPFTLAAWINPKRTGNTWQQVFRATKADNTSCDTLFLNNDGRLSWRSRVATVWGTMCETAAGVVPANQWTHITVTGDGTNFRIYVNGALTQTSAWRATDGTNANYYVGGDPASTGESYAGMADDVRVYSRVLSSEELLSLAGLTKPVAKPF